MSRYEIHWYSDAGDLKRIITDYSKLEYIRKENGIGAMALTMPFSSWYYKDFKVDDILEIWREKNGVLSLLNETAYFLRKWDIRYKKGETLVVLTAYDANYLLDGRIITYYAGETQSSKTDYADDMIKEISNENIGSGTGNADRTYITVASDLSECASVTKGFAWRNVLTVSQEIAQLADENGDYLAFDVVRTNPCEFELRTYHGQRGRDHSRDSGDPRLVSVKTGNLLEVDFVTDHTQERNYIYVGGQGELDARAKVESSNTARINASLWNRREKFADGRNVETTEALNGIGDEQLAEYKPTQTMTGKIMDTEGMQFGVHYGFGDLLTIEAFGFAVDCHVNLVHMIDDRNGENIDIRLSGEL